MKVLELFEAVKFEDTALGKEYDELFAQRPKPRPGQRKNKLPTLSPEKEERYQLLSRIDRFVDTGFSNVKAPTYGPRLHATINSEKGLHLFRNGNKIKISVFNDYFDKNDSKYDKEFSNTKKGWEEAALEFVKIYDEM